MKTIKFKPFFLTRALWVVVFAGFVLSLMLFLFLAVDLTSIYALSMVIVFLGLIIAFYLNRNEPELIEINDNEIRVQYLNKFFFKRKPFVASVSDFKIIKTENEIMLIDKQPVLQIRKRSVTTDDWNLINGYFKTNTN
jgi:hypothetical protein